MHFLLHHIVAVIHTYSGKQPLAEYIKHYCRTQPQLGSRDRRALSEAAFIYYRSIAFMPKAIPVLEVVRRGLALCMSENRFLKTIFERNDFPVNRDTEAKLLPDMVTQLPECSDGIGQADWLRSLLHQPGLFIRLRKDKPGIIHLLQQHNIPFEVLDTYPGIDTDPFAKRYRCLAMHNGTKVNSILPPEGYTVQDWASQCSMSISARFWDMEKRSSRSSVWDVCAGGGGKSLFWKDKYPADQVLATDIRERILYHLNQRYNRYGISGFQTQAIDVANKEELDGKLGPLKFDALICDVPCSGSGTWSRTPEQLYFFREQQLSKWESLQFSISANAQHYLRAGGLLFYITCSVFARENENIVERLRQKAPLRLLHQQLINGLSNHADSMFIAVFQKL